MQVLQQAIEATKSLDDDKLADYIRSTTFKTVLGDVKFGTDGEWAEARVLQVQFQNVKGTDPMQFKDVTSQVVVSPAAYESGKFVYPYEKAK
jgi:branched-chain amino acid transport system substrate-binding protein